MNPCNKNAKSGWIRHAASRIRNAGAGCLLAIVCVAPAMADDTEIFVNQQAGSRPNILLILDTSGSMSTPEPTPSTYDPTRTYSGGCSRDRIYWRRDDGTDPTCNDVGEHWFDIPQLKCNRAVQAHLTAGLFKSSDGSGQWDPAVRRWVGLDPSVKNQPVECSEDAGLHGDSAGDSRRFAANDVQWTASEQQQFNYSTDGTDRIFWFYSGNWINYNTLTRGSTIDRPRLDIVKDAASSLVRSLTGVNVGLMRYSSNGGSGDLASEGGMIINAVIPVESARSDILTGIDNLTASGLTPLSETLFEAHQYFSGGEVIYGVNSRIGGGSGGSMPSVSSSRVQPEGRLYKSPAESSCQKNYIIYLTDGEPNSDANGETRIEGLLRGQCDGTNEGLCLDDLAEYMHTTDLRNPGVSGAQTVTTYTVGFGREVAGSQLLRDAARRGGGEMFEANDTLSLLKTFDTIVEKIKQGGRSFAAPTVAVNSFNRTETLSDLYVSVFEPGDRFHWDGNLKKYRFVNNRIADADDQPALDANGLFAQDARSIWSAVKDGPDVNAGGAGSRLPDPSLRKLYTFLGNDDNLTATENRVTANNTALDSRLGIGQPGDPSREDLVNWALGADVRDEDGDTTTTVRRKMGDPLHGRPAIVIYGGTAESRNVNDAVVYAPTNDGYLHAVDVTSGTELWAFIPPELLSRLPALFRNDPTASKHYGLDGDVRSFRTDRNQNGLVDGNDRVYLFFGMGRGGSNYYALDITNRNSPKHLWTLGPTQLAGIGQTWAPPAITRINLRSGPTQNEDKLALVLSGGYDTTQDNDSTTTIYNTDALGNRIYVVDAVSGALLWMGGGPGLRADERNLSLSKMNNSIPAGVRVIDLDGDGFGDRMYAADTGGRIWRFDIVIDADRSTAGLQVPDASQLVTGGVIASLGNADESTHPISSTRRFYHAPDVAFIQRRNADSFLSISIGSGWRGHPLDQRIQDRFYSIRDYQPFTKFTQTEYNSRVALVDGDLTDITDINTGAVRVQEGRPGWRLELRLPGGFRGEKVLAESRTFNNAVLFPTYLPLGGTLGCGPLGGNRVYAVSVDDGQPIIDINRDGRTEPSDRYTDLAQGGIAPEVSFFFLPRELQGGNDGGQGGNDPNRRPVLCSVGLEVLPNLCRDAGTAVRTYWRGTPP